MELSRVREAVRVRGGIPPQQPDGRRDRPNEGRVVIPTYTLAELNRLSNRARKLGFWEDVAHWEAEKERLTNEGKDTK